jgi:hypothetical protein
LPPSSPLSKIGAGVFGVSYGIPLLIGIGAAIASDSDTSYQPYMALMVPFGGPLITGALVDASDAGWGLLGVTSGAQVLGLAMIAVGLATAEAPESPVRATAGGLMVAF